ncbi:Hypothetical predicted protein [Lecanosticta acicola]|uniref:Mitochondrial outer membrane protein n=1 Tax=Lecanosticta acicola TaxID=111012 RepID=A0AAI9EDF0_9PEZI|nr:Hypothetical predicted protein [Lecanosticta acicola]
MSNDDSWTESSGTSAQQKPPAHQRSIFSLPPTVKRIFDKFPLVTYEANPLPIRSPKNREEHVLHVFGSEEGVREGRPSFNPGCLRWQTFLKLAGVEFKTVASNNHASPSGVLPFLLPAAQDGKAQEPVPAGNKMKKWVVKEGKKVEESSDLRVEAYMALIEGRVRKAWLYQLYLTPQNSDLVRKLYVSPCSRMPLVQMTIASHLRSAAEAELIKSAGTNVVSALDLIRDAEEALHALSQLLGEGEWFFGQSRPGFFDATVFAYTHLILDDALGWKQNELKDALGKHANLVRHRERIREMYY